MSHMVSVCLTFLRNCQIIFQCGCFSLYSLNLSLLIGIFRPGTSNVILDMLGPFYFLFSVHSVFCFHFPAFRLFEPFLEFHFGLFIEFLSVTTL